MTLLERVQTAARLLDDESLAALANKGLVRRARKDVEAKLPEVKGEKDGCVLLAVEDQTVRVSERLTDSRCSCPAAARCRHVVAAVIALARSAVDQPEPAAGRAGDALLDLDDEVLRRWAGAALLRQALREVAGGVRAECSDGATLSVRFPDWNIVCRFVGPGGLASALCGCHAAGACLHSVAAVLAFQVQAGRRQLSETITALEASDETPRTREHIRLAALAAAEAVLERGFSRLDSGMADRFQTLATSAHGVDLPRLERLLRAMADEIKRWLARDVSAADEALLLRAALVHALAWALAKPRPELVGQHRSRYEPARDIELVGVGARLWRTASGYQGVTVYFWEPATARFATWTEARPLSIAGFDPRARFFASGPWGGCASPQVASSSRIRLPQVFRTRTGRLSGRPGTTMIRLGATSSQMLSPIVDWSTLAERARSTLATGLAEADENAAFVLLAPGRWGAAAFDGQQQQLVLPLIDGKGRRVLAALAQSAENDAAIKDLESLEASQGTLLFGRLGIQAGQLVVEPISLVDATGVRSLGLVGASTSKAAVSLEAPADDEPELDVENGREPVFGCPLGRALGKAWDELEAIAAGGASARGSHSALAEARAQVSSLGLARVAAAIAAVENARTQGSGLPKALLAAAWTVRMAESLLAVETALANLG